MAVVIKKKELTLTSLVKRLFAEVDNTDMLVLAKAIEAAGYKLTTGATTMKVENEHAVLAETPIKMKSVEAALKGSLSYVGKKVLEDHVVDFVKKAYNLMPEVSSQINVAQLYDAVMAKYHANGNANKVAAIKEYRTHTGASLKEAKDKVEAWIEQEAAAASFGGTVTPVDTPKVEDILVEDSYADLSDNPVDLPVASKLMQPVRGTSTGSVYHVIALGTDANVAVRIKKDHDVAIRAVAKNENGHKALKAAGLDSKQGGAHYSVHLHPDSKPLVNKCVGAVLFAMGLDWKGVVGDVQKLAGKGK